MPGQGCAAGPHSAFAQRSWCKAFVVGSHSVPYHSYVAQLSSAQVAALWQRVCSTIKPSVPWQRSGPGATPKAPGVKALALLQLLGHCDPLEPGCWDAQAGSSSCQFPSHAACSGLCLGLSSWFGACCVARPVTGIKQSPPALGAEQDWSGTTHTGWVGSRAALLSGQELSKSGT